MQARKIAKCPNGWPERITDLWKKNGRRGDSGCRYGPGGRRLPPPGGREMKKNEYFRTLSTDRITRIVKRAEEYYWLYNVSNRPAMLRRKKQIKKSRVDIITAVDHRLRLTNHYRGFSLVGYSAVRNSHPWNAQTILFWTLGFIVTQVVVDFAH